ncbi:Acyl-coenzyme A thioesterase PaaI, contains HGG motif [Klenkia soli]|uniref:Acyl-coenzyme A thioesterase PaaI, contains HGG motif n=1 Tax=Klenkia soli TaxID=1052260 RepID=A0A1H0L250_9ACTN|nr:hotdog domain-containing protein [Klenkia soli]SDO62112.1 Acyl-coenzyme A thioesterase PaaI, contains HGG motif [Klenkia soli]
MASTLPLADRAALALAVPLVHALGARLFDPEDPPSGVVLTVEGIAGNGAGGAHASALSALLELAGYLALAPRLADDEHAVSHAVALQLIAAAPVGSEVRATARLDRRGSRLAFLTASATVADHVVARAQLTKSIVPFR